MHLFFYYWKIFRCNTKIRIYIVIKTIIDIWANSKFGSWIKASDRVSHYVAGRMPHRL